MAEKINPLVLYVLMALMVLSGAGLGITLKLMDTMNVKGEDFEHPFFQGMIMFLGESLCIFIYLIQKYQLIREHGSIQHSPGMVKAVEEGMKTQINPLMFAIPMLCDATASTLLLIAYINIPASIAQMMGGFVVFVVSIMSIVFLKRKFYRHHWTGLVLIFTGIAMVAATALLYSDKKTDEDSNKSPILGVMMMVGSILVQGCQYIVEEKLLGSYYLSPMKVVGWEGITGVTFFAILLTILQFIPCSNESLCNRGVVEDSGFAFRQVFASAELMAYFFMNIILVAGMNGLGMVVTKYASAANRVTLQQSKTVIVWIFFLVAPVRGGEKFYFLQLGGFLIMLAGVILYNEIIELPILGFNRYTKNGLERNKLRGKSINYDDDTDHHEKTPDELMNQDATNYTPSSPNRYDYQRNYKRLKGKMENSADTSTKKGDYMKLDGID